MILLMGKNKRTGIGIVHNGAQIRFKVTVPVVSGLSLIAYKKNSEWVTVPPKRGQSLQKLLKRASLETAQTVHFFPKRVVWAS